MFNNYGYNGSTNVNQVLNEIQKIIFASERNEISSEQVINSINGMVNQGWLTVVGQGTNRIAVRINGDISHLIDFQSPKVIIKIPYAVAKGMDDNSREYLLYAKLQQIAYQHGNAEAKYLVDTLPAVSRIKGFPFLIAQEEVIAIEKSRYIQGKGTDREAGECTELILSERFKPQYIRLLSTLDRFCIMADLNPVVAPYQYGFKINNQGQEVLTILDTGYVIPKFYEFKDLVTRGEIKDVRYIIYGRDVDIVKSMTNNDSTINQYLYKSISSDISDNLIHAVANKLNTMGVYLNAAANNPQEKVIPDIIHFMNVYSVYRRHAINSVGGDLYNYFQMITGSRL